MAKRFKLRISRVLPSFQSCRSKDTSSLPSNPVPSFLRLSPVNPNPITLHFKHTTTLAPPPPSKTHQSSLKSHLSSAFSTIGCGFRSRTSTRYLSESDHTEPPPPRPQDFQWEKEEKFHVIAKIYDPETPRRKIYNSENDDVSPPPPPPPPPNTERKKRRHKKKKTATKIRISTSSAESGLFSSSSFDDNNNNNTNNRDDEETETLVSSSRSFSTDSSSESNTHLETISETPVSSRRKKKLKKPKRCVLKNGKQRKVKRELFSPECESPARLSMFLQRLIPCTVDGKVRESFAVVKRSQDPYEDFKRSMMEMILEKQMFEEKDLEQLLHCFLSLNSRQHHGVIVQAFAEIWDVLFCRRSSSSCRVSKAL